MHDIYVRISRTYQAFFMLFLLTITCNLISCSLSVSSYLLSFTDKSWNDYFMSDVHWNLIPNKSSIIHYIIAVYDDLCDLGASIIYSGWRTLSRRKLQLVFVVPKIQIDLQTIARPSNYIIMDSGKKLDCDNTVDANQEHKGGGWIMLSLKV